MSAALWAVTIAEMVVFTLCGALMYHWVGKLLLQPFRMPPLTSYTGNQYITSPAFGSLQPVFKKAAFSFAVPTILFLGALYSVRSSLCRGARC